MKKIQIFLSKFPDNATSWAHATDEIRDISRASREFLEEDNVAVNAVNFASFKTPAEWNTEGKKSIVANIALMSPSTRTEFTNWFTETFN
jgi:hypothetical protein